MSLLDSVKDLFDESNAPDLGPSRRPTALPKSEVESGCNRLASQSRLTRETSDLMLSALLLWHDHLDGSHSLSQDIHSPDGSLLHAIMHRREPDYWNSKYWWRRVGAHPSFEILARSAEPFLSAPEQKQLKMKLLPRGLWDPFAFVDAVEQAATLKSNQELLKKLQALEMRAFLETL